MADTPQVKLDKNGKAMVVQPNQNQQPSGNFDVSKLDTKPVSLPAGPSLDPKTGAALPAGTKPATLVLPGQKEQPLVSKEAASAALFAGKTATPAVVPPASQSKPAGPERPTGQELPKPDPNTKQKELHEKITSAAKKDPTVLEKPGAIRADVSGINKAPDKPTDQAAQAKTDAQSSGVVPASDKTSYPTDIETQVVQMFSEVRDAYKSMLEGQKAMEDRWQQAYRDMTNSPEQAKLLSVMMERANSPGQIADSFAAAGVAAPSSFISHLADEHDQHLLLEEQNLQATIANKEKLFDIASTHDEKMAALTASNFDKFFSITERTMSLMSLDQDRRDRLDLAKQQAATTRIDALMTHGALANYTDDQLKALLPDSGYTLDDLKNMRTASVKSQKPNQLTVSDQISLNQKGLQALPNADGSYTVTPIGATEVSSGEHVYDTKGLSNDPLGLANTMNDNQSDMDFGGDLNNVQSYITGHNPSSSVTSQMISDASQKYSVPWETLTSYLQATNNFDTNSAGVEAAAKKLASTEMASASGLTVGTTGSPFIDATKPGYYDKNLKGLGVSQAFIDSQAMLELGGSPLQTLGHGSGSNSSANIGGIRAAIGSRYSEMLAGRNPVAIRQQVKALGLSLQKQTDSLQNTQKSLNAFDAGFEALIGTFENSGINTNDATIVNETMNDLSKKFTDSGDLRAFQAGLQEVQNEYQNVIARYGVNGVTDTVRNQSANLLNGNITFGDLRKVKDALDQQGQIIVSQSQNQIDSIIGQTNQLLTLSPSDPSQFMSGGAGDTSSSSSTDLSSWTR